MTDDPNINKKSMKQRELERLEPFPEAPYYPIANHVGRATGVLLSDQIEYFCEHFKLIDPFLKDNLKPAAYELRVGYKYSVAGKTRGLAFEEELVIPKFEVAVIEILETINMPNFLIGRWNIRTKWAYRGLIWVGGPQVDPGYRGKLLCPIWNLSNTDFRIKVGDAIAVVDFVTTTPVTRSSKLYKWKERNRIVFEDYDANTLRSGLITDAVEKIKEVKADADSVRTRVDTFIAVTFAALAVLMTAVTLFVTKPQELSYWWDPNVFWLCSGSIFLAILAWIRSRSRGRWTAGVEIAVVAAGLLGLFLLSWRTHTALETLKNRITTLETRSGSEPSGKSVKSAPTQAGPSQSTNGDSHRQ